MTSVDASGDSGPNLAVSLAVLEKRITALEIKMHNQTQRELGKSKPISDQILLINKLLHSKVPAIEKTNEAIKKLIEVSNLYPDNQFVDDKINIILLAENQLRELVEVCSQIKAKQHMIDSNKYRSVTEHGTTLNKLTEDQVRMIDEVKSQNEKVTEARAKYDDIMSKLNESLLVFHNTLDLINGKD